MCRGLFQQGSVARVATHDAIQSHQVGGRQGRGKVDKIPSSELHAVGQSLSPGLIRTRGERRRRDFDAEGLASAGLQQAEAEGPDPGADIEDCCGRRAQGLQFSKQPTGGWPRASVMVRRQFFANLGRVELLLDPVSQ